MTAGTPARAPAVHSWSDFMASNETSVSADVLPQDGDDLSETNLTRTAAKSNLTDYIERGLGFNADFAAGTVDIGSGHAIIQDGVNAYDLFPNQITDLSLPNGSGLNHVFVAIQPGTDDAAYYHIDDTDDPPADPSLKIGTIDTTNETSDTINRNPAGNFRTVRINGTTVLQSDGVIAAGSLPDLAITETFVVADENERLSLDAEEGDLAIQQNVDETFIFTGGDASVDSNWSEIVTSPAQHAASHEKGGSDVLTTFSDTVHDSVSTPDLSIKSSALKSALGRHVVPQSDETGVSDAIDRSLSTPVSDAIAALNGRGVVHIPNGVGDSGDIRLGDFQTIRGDGPRVARLSINDDTNPGVVFDNGDGTLVEDPRLIGLTIRGSLSGGSTPAISSGAKTRGAVLRDIEVSDWYGHGVHIPDDQSYEWTVENLSLRNVDAGDTTQGALLAFENSGVANEYGLIRIGASRSVSGSDQTAFFASGGQHSVTNLNIDGPVDRAVDIRPGAAFHATNVNYEPTNLSTTTPTEVVLLSSTDTVRINQLGVVGQTVSYVYDLRNDPSQAWLSKPSFRNSAGVDNSIIRVSNDVTGTLIYEGTSSEVDNQTGAALTGAIWCIEDGVFKSSTGTGYDGGTNDRQV